MATIFARIAAGEIPSHKVAENEEFFAFLDIHPLMDGHVLVIPREEVNEFFSLDNEKVGRMMQFSHKVAQAIKEVIPCNRVGVLVSGLEVPHAHMHLIPINKASDITSNKPLVRSAEELNSTATLIKEKFNANQRTV